MKTKGHSYTSGSAFAPWLILASGIIAALHVGKLSPALSSLTDAFQLTAAESGWLLSVIQLVGATSSVLLGFVIGQIGPRTSLLTGLLVTAISSLAGGWASSGTQLLILRILEGLGFVLIVLPGPGLLRQFVHPRKINLWVGYWGGFMGAGVGMAMLMGPRFIDISGWQNWWIFCGLITILVMFLAYLVIPAATISAVCLKSGSYSERIKKDLLCVIQDPRVGLLSGVFSLCAGQWLAVMGFLPSIYEANGLDSNQISIHTALIALSSVIGNLLAGRLLHHSASPIFLVRLSYSAMVIASIVVFSYPAKASFAIPYASAIVFSFFAGVIPAVVFSIVVNQFGASTKTSTVIGLVQQTSAFAQLSIPPILGWYISVAGGWSMAWTLLLSLSTVGVLLTAKLSPSVSVHDVSQHELSSFKRRAD